MLIRHSIAFSAKRSYLFLACFCFLFWPGNAPAQQIDDSQTKKQFAERFRHGFIFDERLSAARTAPDIQAEIKQRLRRGRKVYVLESIRDRNGVLFHRIAVTRRTRGWVLAAAIAFPGANDEARILALAAATTDIERLSLCHLLLEKFPASRLRPKALLLFGEEAENVANRVLRRANRRLSDDNEKVAPTLPASYYYLNDVGLDRYNRLGARFGYDEATDEYFYTGDAYREIRRRYPQSQEAIKAREKLAVIDARLKLSQKK